MAWEIEHVLRGEEAGELLRSALASSGVTLHQWHMERVYSRPTVSGLESSGRYRVVSSAGELILVASTRTLTDSQREALGAVRAESSVGTVHVWAHPRDPELPGLPVVEDSQRLGARLSELRGEPVEVTEAELLVLRPLRRAVYRVGLRSPRGAESAYIKVLRPAVEREALARHAACPLAPPAVPIGDALLYMPAASGQSMLHRLYHRDPEKSPMSPTVLISALDRLSEAALSLRPRRPPWTRVHKAVRAAESAGVSALRLEQLTTDLLRRLPDSAPTLGTATDPPMVAVHGDFHPGNIFLTHDDAAVSALIDTDTVGPGQRVDDLAMLCAHLSLLPGIDPEGYASVPAVYRGIWDYAMDSPDQRALPMRTAAALLSLLPGMRTPEHQEFCLSAVDTLLKEH